MKKFNVALVVFCLFGFGSTIQAQNTILATGGNASGVGGKISYSVGQLVYTTNTSATYGSVAQGVQQAFEISEVTGIEEANGISLSVSAYPNPTSDYLTLDIEGNVQTQYFVSLYDIQGKLLKNRKITSNQTSIFMGNLLPATYFIKVIVKTQDLAPQEVKTFKIIKSQ